MVNYRCYDYKKSFNVIEFNRYYLYFMLYSFAGWLWEKIFMLIIYHTFEERGFLHIPICSIYGFGILLVLFLFYEKNYSLTTIFLGSAFVTCALEFFTSWEMEKLFHRTWWDYSGWIFNFQGRISFLSSIAFGIGSILVVKFIQPLLCKVLDKYFRLEISKILGVMLLIITVIDLIFTNFNRSRY